MPRITIVHGDDWRGFYVDGELRKQGHEIHLDELLEAIGVDHEIVWADLDWLAQRGDLPPTVDEVVGAA